jgi:hypothetical protein
LSPEQEILVKVHAAVSRGPDTLFSVEELDLVSRY